MLTGEVVWNEGMAFIAQSGSGHEVVMDATEAFGGEDRGPSPKELTLLSLGGCTGMDIVSLLRKMQVPFDRFSIALEADTAEEHPTVFREIRMVYRVAGDGVDRTKVDRAIELSQERYCGVLHMLNKTAKVRVVSEVNGERRTIA